MDVVSGKQGGRETWGCLVTGTPIKTATASGFDSPNPFRPGSSEISADRRATAGNEKRNDVRTSGLVICGFLVSAPGFVARQPIRRVCPSPSREEKTSGMDSVVFLSQFRKGRSGLRQTALTGFQLNSTGKRRSIQ